MYGQRARRACERNAAVILVRPTDSYPSLYLAADDNRDQLARGRSEPSSGARHCAPLVRKHRCCCSDIDCTSSSLQLDHPLAISTRMTNNLRVARTPVRQSTAYEDGATRRHGRYGKVDGQAVRGGRGARAVSAARLAGRVFQDAASQNSQETAKTMIKLPL